MSRLVPRKILSRSVPVISARNAQTGVVGGQMAIRDVATIASRSTAKHPDGASAWVYMELTFLDWEKASDPHRHFLTRPMLDKDPYGFKKDKPKSTRAPPMDLGRAVQPSKNNRRRRKGKSGLGDGRSRGPDPTPAALRLEGQGKAEQKTNSGPSGSRRFRSLVRLLSGEVGRTFTALVLKAH
jgi:hypothetical protein